MSLYTGVVRPLLFRVPAERAQRVAERALQWHWLWDWATPSYHARDPRLHTTLARMPLESPVGLAAGFDKDCRALDGLARLGFGYLLGGTVFLTPREGNPRPRLTRIPDQEALINALGFPSQGVDRVLATVRRRYVRSTTPLAAVGGKSRGQRPSPSRFATRLPTPFLMSIAALSLDGFLYCHRLVEPWCDGVELNISSPNTEGIAAFQEPDMLQRLLAQLAMQRLKSLFVKLPAAWDEASRERVLALAEMCKELGVNGVTAGNARPVEDPSMKVGRGGLSGRPLLEDTLRTVAALRERLGSEMTINACGGIFTGEDTFRALREGATTVQLYTALVYQGPGVVKRINQELLACLEREGAASVRDIR